MTEEERPPDAKPDSRSKHGDDAWETESSDSPVRHERAMLVPTRSDPSAANRDDPERRGQFGLRSMPIGYKTIISHLARENYMSFTNVTVQAAELGMNRLDDEDRIVALRRAHKRVSDDAMERGDLRAMHRLDGVVDYDFVHSQGVHKTLTVSARTKARITQLADICGMPGYRLAVIAVYVGILALNNMRDYRRLMQEEVDAFREHVLEVTDDLGHRGPKE